MPGFRDEYCTTVYQHRLYLHGGNDVTDIIYTPDLWELDLTTYVWTLLDGNTTASNFTGRALCQASVQNVMNAVTGANELKLIIAGGQNNGFQTSSWQWVFYIFDGNNILGHRKQILEKCSCFCSWTFCYRCWS